MRRLGVLVVLVGCGQPSAPQRQPQAQPRQPQPRPPQPQPQPPAELVVSEIDPPFPLPSPSTMPDDCLWRPIGSGRGTAGVPRSHKTYDFNAIEIAPVARGPRIRDMPIVMARTGTLSGLQRDHARRKEALHQCYRWARWKQHDLAGTMKVRLALTPTGDLAGVTVADAATWGELGRCVAEALPEATARTLVPMTTRIELPVTFVLSGQDPPPKRPARPAKLPRTKVKPACVVPPGPDVDAITWASPLVTVNDFDEAQDEKEKQDAACKATGKLRCRVAISPIVGRLGGAGAIGDVDKAIIRTYVRYNQGAFGACFADAAARKSAADGGEVGLLFEIRDDGAVPTLTIEKSSTGDAVLDECVRAAMAEVRFPAAAGNPNVVVHMPFKAAATVAAVPAPAERDTIANIEASAKAALEAGDGATALRRYAALAQHQPTCERRLDVLEALVASRPWIDDGVMAAVTDFVASAPTGACAAEAQPLLAKLVVDGHRVALKTQNPRLVEIAAERYQLILRIADLPEADTIRGFLAHALRDLGRDTGGVEPLEPKL